MSVVTPVLVLPGHGNSGPQHWQSLWQRRHPQWQRVNLGEWDRPVCDDWVRALDVAVRACPSPPMLIAHSLACLLVAHWAHRSALVPEGAFLVAVPDPQGKLSCQGTWVCTGADAASWVFFHCHCECERSIRIISVCAALRKRLGQPFRRYWRGWPHQCRQWAW
jgi:predicted alpha/beta hydrolase family esterase